jgi:hypothetical protein
MELPDGRFVVSPDPQIPGHFIVMRYSGEPGIYLEGLKPEDMPKAINVVSEYIQVRMSFKEAYLFSKCLVPGQHLQIAATSSFCYEVEVQKSEWGYLSGGIKSHWCVYCDSGVVSPMCTSAKKVQDSDLFGWIIKMFDDKTIGEDPKNLKLDEFTWETAKELFWWMLPIGYSLIPLMYLTGGEPHRGKGLLAAIVMAFVCMCTTSSSAIILLNVGISFVSVGLDPSSGEIQHIVSSYLILFFVSFFSVFPYYWIKIGVVSFMLLMYLMVAYHLFFIKRGGSQTAVIITVLEIAVMHEQIVWMRGNFAAKSFTYDALEMLFSSVLPCGKSFFYTRNAAAYAQVAAKFLHVDFLHQVKFFLGFFLGQVILFIGIRICIGSMYLSSLRYKLTFDDWFSALMIYCSDIFGPIGVALNVTFGREKFDCRRAMYAIVAGTMTFYEFQYAAEFVMIRVILSMVDWLFYSGKHGKQHRYLAADIEFVNQVFPQVGALPPLRFEEFQKLRNNTFSCTSKFDDVLTRGAGFRMQKDKRDRFYSISHAIGDHLKVLSRTGRLLHEVMKPRRNYVGNAIDPVVWVDLDDAHASGAEIEVATRGVLDQIETLVCLCPDPSDDEDVRMRVIPSGSFSLMQDGTFSVKSTFIKGESGSPVFGVTGTGRIYYCGAVSSGNYDDTGGNIVTSCIPIRLPIDTPPPSPTPSVPSTETGKTLNSSVDAIKETRYLRRRHVMSEGSAALRDAWNAIVDFYVDPSREKGWFTESEWRRQMEKEQEDQELQPDTDDDQANSDRKAKARRKHAKNFSRRRLRWMAQYNPIITRFRSVATLLYDSDDVEALIERVESRPESLLRCPDFHCLSIGVGGLYGFFDEPESFEFNRHLKRDGTKDLK